MKKQLVAVVMTGALLFGAAGLSACNTQPEREDAPHAHSYASTVVPPSCGVEGFTLHRCECGDEYKDGYTEALKHSLRNDSCINCGKGATAGLEISGGVLTGLGEAKNKTDIIIPSSVTKIGDEAFYGSAVKYVTLPSSVSEIGERAFWATDLVYVTMPSVTKIGYAAFLGCHNLEEIELKNVKTIGKDAFSDCTALTKLNLPASLETIEVPFANYCDGLKEVTVADGNGYFYTSNGCIIERATGKLISAVGSYKLPASGSVTEIAAGAFMNAKGIENFVIPAGIKKVSENAFGGSDLKRLTIGKDVNDFAPNAINVSSSDITPCELESITVDPDNATYYSEKNCLIERDTKKLVLGCKNSVIPDDVKEIGFASFRGCKNLGKVVIPASVTKIGNYAFWLSDITELETSVLGDSAFGNCNRLKKVTLKDGLTQIATGCFSGDYALNTVVLPSTLTTINSRAFSDCVKLVEVYNLSSLSLTAGSSSNGNVAQYAKAVYTDLAAQSKIKTKDGWLYFEDGDSVTLLGYGGSAKEAELTNLDFNGKTAAVDKYVFAGIDVDSLTLNGIANYDSYMFRYAVRIKNLVINGNVTFAQRVFVRSVYENVTVNGATDIGLGFYQNTFKTVTLNGVQNIAAQALRGSEALEKVTFGSGLQTIGDYAFYECPALKEVVLPEGLTSVGLQAFINCAIEKLALPSTLTEIKAFAFWGNPLVSLTAGGSWQVYLARENEPEGWFDAELTAKNLIEGYSDGVWQKK